MAQVGKEEVVALLGPAARVPRETPLGAAGRGAVAGLAATALLSVLSRLTDPLWQRSGGGGGGGGGGKQQGGGGTPQPPKDPFDRQQVIEWQKKADSPAAYQQQGGGQGSGGRSRGAQAGGRAGGQGGGAAAVTPAAVLAEAQAPGPEGIAAQFAQKLAAGMFGRDISRSAQPAGEAVHFAYGSAWGALYGLVQSSYRRAPGPFGLLFGFVVWLAGPALLVPAMRLMPPPPREHPVRLALMVAGHLVYGLAVAATFEALEREAA